MFGGREITYELIAAAVGVSVSVVTIFILVSLFIWCLDLRPQRI
jgi:hypothetical protein